MKITLNTPSSPGKPYDLTVQPEHLLFRGEDTGSDFSVPYGDIRDFQVTENRREKLYFTMITGGVMFEGMISDRREVDPFLSALKKQWGGVMNIEVRKN